MQNEFSIRFELTNEFGSEYTQSARIENFDVYDSDLEFIGEQLNCFLRQCGYIRKNDCMFMEDITEEEREVLMDCLHLLRVGESHENQDKS